MSNSISANSPVAPALATTPASPTAATPTANTASAVLVAAGLEAKLAEAMKELNTNPSTANLAMVQALTAELSSHVALHSSVNDALAKMVKGVAGNFQS